MASGSKQGIYAAVPATEGGGLAIARAIPAAGLTHIGPFVFLDHIGPSAIPPYGPKGTPDHPHAGIDVASFMIEGISVHRDSMGNHAEVGPGGVQWMTSGRGVLHSERPTDEFHRDGGPLHAIQLWIKLPQRDELMAPRYQEAAASALPRVTLATNVTATVVAGSLGDAHSPIETRSPLRVLYVVADGPTEFSVAADPGHALAVYVMTGRARLDRFDHDVERSHIAIVDGERASVSVEARSELLVLSGLPLDEPMVHHGPYVLSTMERLQAAHQRILDGHV